MGEEFTETFNVRGEQNEYREYKSFIGRLRFKTQDRDRRSHGVPLLPPQPPRDVRPTRFFDVVLSTANSSLRLRLRRDNLYLIAYRSENGVNGQWNELQDDFQLVPGSNVLRFSGNYIRLTQVANATRENIDLGGANLGHAVETLARNPQDDAQKARSLIVVIQMVCESMRFKEIYDYFGRRYADNFKPTERITLLENWWSALSYALMWDDTHPRRGVLHLEKPNPLDITTIDQVVEVLAMVLFQTVPVNNVQAAIGQDSTQNGRYLVELFDMRILNINGEGPSKIYGAITAANGLQSEFIYNRDREDHESIEAGQNATLTGPSRTISATDYFTIDFNLEDRDAPSADDEVAQSRIAWNANDQTNNYDKLRTETINGPSGSAVLDYVVMSNASEALVDIFLVDRDREDPANIYGEIYAQTSVFPDKKIQLFRRESHDHVGVHLHSCIPLLRSALAVPIDATLTISACLGDHSRTSDKEIVNATAEFKPATLQSASGLIMGQHGKLEIRVSWI